MGVVARLRETLATEKGRWLIESGGRSLSRGEVAEYRDVLLAMLARGGVSANAPIGLIARNRLLNYCALVGLASAGRTVAVVHPFQTTEKLATDLVSLRFAVILADVEDWSAEVRAAAAATGSMGIALDSVACATVPVAGLERMDPAVLHRPPEQDPGIEILSSGTTGPPKRILLPYRSMDQAVTTAQVLKPAPVDPLEPHVMVLPLSVFGGAGGAIGHCALGRPVVLLEKFAIDSWVEAIERHRIQATSFPAAAARMLLDADVPPARLASLRYALGGGAPMSPELQTEFEARYGVKVLWAYGATEFCGTLIAWTPEFYGRFDPAKRGALGRVVAGAQIRVTDTDTGLPLPTGETGFLEALIPSLSKEWIRSTDLVLIDEDDFVFHKGRGDGAIIRGGFKVIPEQVAAALRGHPAVRDCVVLGIADHRLGFVPVAAVELYEDFEGEVPNEGDLKRFARTRLVANQIPTRIKVLGKLPRTDTMKPSISIIREMFAGE